MSNTVPENHDQGNVIIPQRGDAGGHVGDGCDRVVSWLAENRAALESSNAFVAKHGLPLTPIWAVARERRRRLGDTTTS